MIGGGIGSRPIGGGGGTFVAPPLGANIFLSGTFGFQSSYRIASRVDTFLNFTLINSDDNVVQVGLVNILTGQPIPITGASVTVNVYAPGTVVSPVITKTGVAITISASSFQFSLTSSDVSSLMAGNYPWIASISLPDGTRHTVNCGDINLTTGLIEVVSRP